MFSRHRVVAVFFHVLITVCGSVRFSEAQLAAVSLSGTLSDPAGKPVAGATVTLVGQGLSGKTDGNGKYSLVRAGTALRVVTNQRGTGSEASGRIRFDGGWLLHPGAGGDGDRFVSAAGRSLPGAVSPERAASDRGFPDRVSVPGSDHASENASENASDRGLAKTAAAGDSLDVLAIGFQREGRALTGLSGTQDFKLKALAYTAVPYKTGANLTAYEKQICNLDVHVPAGPMKKWPVIVHLHGGGLQEGDSKEGWSAADKNNFVRKIHEQGYLIVAVNYRLGIDPDLPDKGGLRGKWPDYLQDAAVAVAWAKRNVEAYGGDTANFFVMGYSAGAWQAMMLATDTTWYKEIGFKEDQVSGYIALSTHMTTYFQYAVEQNIPNTGLSIAAVLTHIRKVDVPMHLFVGGLEGQRITDNQSFLAKMKAAGTPDIAVSVMPGRDHQQIVETIGNAVDETRTLILEFLKKHTR